jgi:hypothetical protein
MILMVTERTSWYKRFEFESCQGCADAPELQRQREMPAAGDIPEINRYFRGSPWEPSCPCRLRRRGKS